MLIYDKDSIRKKVFFFNNNGIVAQLGLISISKQLQLHLKPSRQIKL